MNVRSALLAVLAAGAGTALATFSCGRAHKKSADGGTSAPAAAQSSQTQPGQDVTQAFTLKISGGNVVVPAGALGAGSTLAVAPGVAPGQFSEVAGETSASAVVSVTAKDGNDQPVLKAQAPLTVALELSPAAALDGVARTDTNICVFGYGADQVFRVWRSALLAIDSAAGTVSYPAIWLGVYQLYYCGTDRIPGSVEVLAGGDKVIHPPGGDHAYATCNLAQGALGPECYSYVGKLYAQAGETAAYESSCAAAKGTFGTAPCPPGAPTGTCAYSYGTALEFALVYYASAVAGAPPAGTLQKTCETVATNKWFAAGSYVPTAAPQQVDATPPGAASATATATGAAGDAACAVTGTSCMEAATSLCTQLSGAASTGQAACGARAVFSASVCTTANRLGCCAKISNIPAGQADLVFYAGGPFTAAAAAAACGGQGGTWTAP